MNLENMVNTARPILEMLSFLSGPVIAVFAYIGLRQLKISKDTARMSATREAYKLSAEQCNYYFGQIVPLIDKLDISITKKKIEFFNKTTVEVRGRELKISYSSEKNPFDEIEPVARELLDVLNKLESFSVFFMSRVAAESVAFTSVGQTFCYNVRRFMPIIVLVSDGEYFQNVMKLFVLWNNRIEGKKLILNKTKIEKRLEEINDKVINPLGT